VSAALLTALDRWLAAHGSSGAELAGFAFGVLNVWLVTRQHIWSWPVGIANAAFYVVVFARAGLYSDTGLQALYIALSVYGWVQWLRGGPGRTPLRVGRTTAPMAGRLAVAVLAGWALLATITARLPGSSLPALDAALVSGSLVAQFMMTRKLRESWLVWITVDVIYVGMFVYKQLLLTAVLYGVFTLLAVHGHRAWSRSLARASPASS
jgi:nicotinamide mononucleotide transporter